MANEIIGPLVRPVFDYNTPRQCKKCGVVFSGRGCKDCKNAAKRARRAAHPEKVKAAASKLRLKNKEKLRLAAREYRLRNPEAVSLAKKKHRDKHKTPEQVEMTAARAALIARKLADPEWNKKTAREKRRERGRSYRDRFPERVKAQLANWVAANPEYNRIKVQNRRAKRIAAGGALSQGLAAKLYMLQKGRCACCGGALGQDYHLDHIQPLAKGGEHADSNMQLLLSTCNLEKHARDPIEFMQERGFLL